MSLKILIQTLKNKSNIDYHYYHEFDSKALSIDYNINNFTINYIVFIINSDFSCFEKFYHENKNISITDVFLDRLNLNFRQKKSLFSMVFKNLFWIKLNNLSFTQEDYFGLINFLNNNSLDVNRIFFENLELEDNFFHQFKNLKGFDNLTFVNFDNNNLSNNGLDSLLFFLKNNNIKLEYLSLIGNKISSIESLLNYLEDDTLRILDLSLNSIKDISKLFYFIQKSNSINEIYLSGIFINDENLDFLFDILSIKSNLDVIKLSIDKKQEKYYEKFLILGKVNNINIDVSFLEEQNKIYSTLYFKVINNKNTYDIQNDYFYLLEDKNLDLDFENIIDHKSNILNNGINLFLFDFHDYKKIDYLLDYYNFNYIYIENYKISDDDFIYFINSVSNKKLKKYKINFISIEINEFQLDYLINNFPENIYYIEINLNKIQKNRELFIAKMLKNKAFIFENMELYSKIFK